MNDCIQIKKHHSCSVFPESVKQELGLSEEEYKKEKMKLTVSHKGNKELKTFDYICCSICQEDKIPVVLEKYKDKLPEHAKVNDLIDQWDILGVADNLLDLAGCFIPDDKNVHAALNGRQFILRPTEHSAFHSKPSFTTGKAAITSVSTNKLVPNEKRTIRTEQSVTHTSKDKSTKVTLENNHQLKMMHIGNLLDPKDRIPQKIAPIHGLKCFV